MSEIFFQQLTQKQWRLVKDFILANHLHASIDSETNEALIELTDLISQFCEDSDEDS